MLSTILYIALAFFTLGFSIFIHELGHFIAAKKRGLIADRFSIGFGHVFSVGIVPTLTSVSPHLGLRLPPATRGHAVEVGEKDKTN